MKQSELIAMLKKVNAPSEGRFARLGVDMFQRKGQDFSEEVNAHFVKAGIRSSSVRSTIDVLLQYNHRIGAWTSTNSLNYLLSKLPTTDVTLEASTVLKLLQELPRRGVVVDERAFTHAVKFAAAKKDVEVLSQLAEVASTKGFTQVSEEATKLSAESSSSPSSPSESAPVDAAAAATATPA